MSGDRKSMDGAAARQMSIRCGNGPPLGYWPGRYPGLMRAALTNMGSSYSAFPAAATACVALAKCQAMKTSSVARPWPKTCSHEPDDLWPWDSQRAVSYTHLRAHETRHELVCRLLLEKK